MRSNLCVCALVLLASTACANLPSKTARHTGCPRSKIEIAETQSTDSQTTWTATCVGRTFHCTETSDRKVTCQPAGQAMAQAQPMPAPPPPAPPAPAPEPEASTTPPEPAAFPADAAGFGFGQSAADSENACKTAGHAWKRGKKSHLCTGSPVSIGFTAETRLSYCAERLCRVDLLEIIAAPQVSGSERFASLRDALQAKYGPAKLTSSVPNECSARVDECVRDGRANMRALWAWPDGKSITVELTRLADKPAVYVTFLESTETAPAAPHLP